MGWRRVARFLRVGKDRAGIRSDGSSGRRNCRGRRDEANSAYRLTESLHYPLPLLNRSCAASTFLISSFLPFPLRLDSLRSSFPPRSTCHFVSRKRDPPPAHGTFWLHCQQTAKLFAKIVGSFRYDSSTLTLPRICDTLALGWNEFEEVDWAAGLKSYRLSTRMMNSVCRVNLFLFFFIL